MFNSNNRFEVDVSPDEVIWSHVIVFGDVSITKQDLILIGGKIKVDEKENN